MPNSNFSYKPVMIMILDGWGLRAMEHGNAILQANTPNYDRWSRELERSVVDASGEAVGLIPDQMGNSEVGHLNLGAGRIVYQDISRINNDIHSGAFYEHELLTETIQAVKANGKRLHLIGLLGTGGVHALDTHQFALLKMAHQHGIEPLIHVITDGRDTSPGSAAVFLQDLQAQIDQYGGTIATVSGRYYAMDRDKRWERTGKAYDAIVKHQSDITAPDAATAIQQSYDNDVMDEFILPTVIDPGNDALGLGAGDVLVCFNFRADRMRQIVQMLVDEDVQNETNVEPIPDLTIITMTQYASGLPVKILYPIEIIKNPLAEVLASAGKKQFHIAETEKYPHVTYFFNGRREELFPGEEREIVPSPKVATYDLQPEMSAHEVADVLLKRIENGDDDFLLINFANPDMVGHTGDLAAAIKAAEVVDELAGKIVEAVVAKGGAAIVTADHGNSDRMIDEVSGEPHTYHTTSPVPLFVVADQYIGLRPRGILADVAPTALELLGVDQPPEMTGRSLIKFDL
ncbi:MAG: 2,3-bisphosphoglycerate-independent phosphoglycerate mutase [Anaerolineales bacterium]